MNSTLRLTGKDIQTAARLLRQGLLVALPTETVYGLAANALDGDAVRAVFEAKGRPPDNPLIVHVARPGQAAALTAGIPEPALRLMDAFWPGPLTLVMPAAPSVPKIVTAGLSTVAVRCPDHPVMREVLESCGLPLAAPSANLSGRPSPTDAAHVLSDLDGRIAAIVDGGPCRVGLESSVLDMTSNPPCLLRPGAVTKQMLEAELGIEIATSSGHDGAPRSPGMKYRHYAPATPMFILRGTPDALRRWAESAGNIAVLCCDGERGLFRGLKVYTYGASESPDDMMRGLYRLLREADESGAPQIAATCPEGGALEAFRDRLYRAAGYNELRT